MCVNVFPWLGVEIFDSGEREKTDEKGAAASVAASALSIPIQGGGGRLHPTSMDVGHFSRVDLEKRRRADRPTDRRPTKAGKSWLF